MSIADLRNDPFEPIEWEDRIVDEKTGDVLVEGTAYNEVVMNRYESGMMLSHFDIGLATTFALQMLSALRVENEKLNRQRILQGQATISANASNGYFRDAEPFTEVSPGGLAQINSPHYDVFLTPLSSDDLGRVGDLVVYDKTQNGFKVKMTGSANLVTFMWTLINPRV